MDRLDWLILLGIGAAAIGTGGINSLGVVYWQGFPTPWFFDLALILLWINYRRRLDESTQTDVPSTE